MLPASGKFGLNRYVTSSGSLGTFDVDETQTAKFVVTNAAPGNIFTIKGKITGQNNYVAIDTIIGSITKTIDITQYDYIEVEATNYTSITNYVQIDGSGFATSLVDSPIGNINVSVSLIPSEDGVHIADKTTGVPLKVNNDGSINVTSGGSAPNAPVIVNFLATTLNTEYPIQLPTGTKKVLIKVRDYASTLKFAWVSGDSGTNFIQINRGCSYTAEGLDLTTTNRTLYVQSSKSGVIIEILTWQ